MTYDHDWRHRRSIRLQGYDYRQGGAYFVTVVAHNRLCLFGDIVNDVMQPNDAGDVVQSVWEGLPNHYAHVELDAFVIMPNHIHGIIVLLEPSPNRDDANVGAGLKPAPVSANPAVRHGLPEIVRALKTFSARRINELRQTPGVPVWQRNYYEHIIRNEADLRRIQQYILDNPAQWASDAEYQGHVR